MSISGLIKRAEAIAERGDLRTALEIYREAVHKSRKVKKVTEDVLLAYNNMIILMLRLNNTRDGLIEAKKYALEFVRAAKKTILHSDMYANACFIAGLIMLSLEDYKGAIKHLEDAAIVFELIDHKEGLMLACKNLAEAYSAISYKERAQAYSMRAKTIAKQLNQVDKLIEMDNTIKGWRSLPLSGD